MSLVRYRTFTDLLAEANGSPIENSTLVDLAYSSGRVLLQGPAGAGKSWLLNQIANQHQGITTNISRVPRDAAISELRERLWEQPAPGADRLLLCVDGLDECDLSTVEEALATIESGTEGRPSIGVIVADRLGRRDVRSTRWALVALDSSEMTPAWASLAFYAERIPASSASRRVDVIEHWLHLRLGKLDHATMNRLFAFARRTWTVEGNAADVLLDDNVASRLVRAGVLRRSPTDALEFVHPLLQSYFIVRGADKTSSAWTSAFFNELTKGGAFDASLPLFMESIEDRDVDSFVRAVDNWNFYAAAFLLADDQSAEKRVGNELRVALLLLLGLRRFSRSRSTATQVEDWLRRHGGAVAARALLAGSRAELATVAEFVENPSPWFRKWLSIFDSEQASGVLVDLLSSDDTVCGWTAANVLHEMRDVSGIRGELLNVARTRGSSDAARWRAIHAMAGLDDMETIRICVDNISSDPSRWIRYGCLRTFFLVASNLATAADRKEAFSALAEVAEILVSDERMLREVERSIAVVGVPTDWPGAVGILLERLWGLSKTIEGQDRWRTASAKARTGWAPTPILGDQ
jgi:hypothetical protein